MSQTYTIKGPVTLHGKVRIQGAKNAAQKILPATILVPGKHRIENLPDIADTRTHLNILNLLGAKITKEDGHTEIDTTEIKNAEIPQKIAAQSSGTFVFAAPLMARFGHVTMWHPGGDDIGVRPVTRHLKAFEQLGARVAIEKNRYVIDGSGMRGAKLSFEKVTVNGTANAILAACGASGESVIENASLEPEIDNQIEFLRTLGFQISRKGNSIVVEPSIKRQPGHVRVIPDKNEAATFLVAGALCGDNLELADAPILYLTAMIDTLGHMGVIVEKLTDRLIVSRRSHLRPTDVITEAYPGFSTDQGPFLVVLMTQADGTSTFYETVYSDRFDYVPELQRMGGNIEPFDPKLPPKKYSFPVEHESKPHALRVHGWTPLHGTDVHIRTLDVRGAAALVLAGLAAEGTTVVHGVENIERGYQRFVERMNALGAAIKD